MMHHFANERAFLTPMAALLLGSALYGCALGSDLGAGGGVTDGGSTSSQQATIQSGSTVGSGFETAASGTGGAAGQIAEVFGHSATTLYKLNPETKAVGVVGPFKNCTGIQDIALDKDSRLLGTTKEGLFEISKTTGDCTEIAAGDYPNSLSFVPKGTVDPDVEALVGYVINENMKNQFIRIDPMSGAVTNIGQPWNDEYVSSGDIVSVIGGPTYLTVKRGDLCMSNDCLVEINPSTGQIQRFLGSVGYAKVFGAAFWAGKVYGFTQAGELFEISINGSTIATSPIMTPSGLSFWGAGSTTSAPPVPK